ncbi:hypothetical protein WJX77_002621 [Trebouxia sp. C0004]
MVMTAVSSGLLLQQVAAVSSGPPARQELLLPRDFPLLCFLAIAGSGQAPQGFLLLLRAQPAPPAGGAGGLVPGPGDWNNAMHGTSQGHSRDLSSNLGIWIHKLARWHTRQADVTRCMPEVSQLKSKGHYRYQKFGTPPKQRLLSIGWVISPSNTCKHRTRLPRSMCIMHS